MSIKIRVSNAGNGGQIQSVDFCDQKKVDVADVVERLHIDTNNMKMYLNGYEAKLGDSVKNTDIISIQKENSKSGLLTFRIRM